MNPESDASDIDFRAIVLELWSNRLVLLCSAFFGAIVAGSYATFVAKPVFESTVLLIPTEVPKEDQLGTAAALLSKRQTSLGDVSLYQTLLMSRQVINGLLHERIPNLSDSAGGRMEPVYRILNLDSAKAPVMEQAIKDLSRSVSVEAVRATAGTGSGGIVQVTVSASSPWLAQELATAILGISDEATLKIRVERNHSIGARLAIATDQARREWDSAAIRLSAYRDRNRSIVLADQILAQSRLEMDKQAKEQKYLMARKELEMLELETLKAAPPMLILDPANLPATKTRPKRSMMVVVGSILGLFGAMTFQLGRSFLKKELMTASASGES